MTAYRYRAARLDGEILSGTLEASSSEAALHVIAERGLFPVSVETASAPPPRARQSSRDLAVTLSGLAALLEAGLPADQALTAGAETAPAGLKSTLTGAAERVRQGESLSAALQAGGAMPPVVIGYLRAGERSGRLAAAVARAAEEIERASELGSRVRAALTYPAFLAVAGFTSTVAIVGFVVPRFAGMLGTEGRALPATTRTLLEASDILTRFGMPALVLVSCCALFGWRWAASPGGRIALHHWLLQVPIAGRIRFQLASARASATLASLLDAGVPALSAIDMARDSAADGALAARFSAASLDVDRGERLATSLERHRALSPTALRLLAFGERSGRVTAFLEQASRLEAAAAQRSLQRLVVVLEPALILGFGLVVAFVAAALLQAVYSVRPAGF